jgi:predicted negative regulator of RcsB-dependent stress response
MASASTARRSSRTAVDSDDAMTMRAAEMKAWAEKNARLVMFGAGAVVLLLGALIYYQFYKGQRAERAATAFLALQSSLPSDTPGVIRRLETFGSTYGGTSEGAEARILAAQLWLDKGDAKRAIATVRPAADGGTAVEPQAKLVLGAALAADGKRQEAIDTYLDVAKSTDLAYLKQDALAAAAVLREAANDWRGAADLYRQALETTEENTADRALMQLRLTEAEAHAGLPISTPKQ